MGKLTFKGVHIDELGLLAHLVVIILGVLTALLAAWYKIYYLSSTNDALNNHYSGSILHDSLSSEMFSKLLVASVFIVIPLWFQLILDIIQRVFFEIGDQIPIQKYFKGWCVQLLYLSGVLFPAIALLLLSNASAGIKCSWYICLTITQWLVLTCTTFLSLASLDDPYWSFPRTLSISILTATGWVLSVWCNMTHRTQLESTFIAILVGLPTLMFLFLTVCKIRQLVPKAFAEGFKADDWNFIVTSAGFLSIVLAGWIISSSNGWGDMNNWANTPNIMVEQYQGFNITITILLTVLPTRMAKHEAARAKVQMTCKVCLT